MPRPWANPVASGMRRRPEFCGPGAEASIPGRWHCWRLVPKCLWNHRGSRLPSRFRRPLVGWAGAGDNRFDRPDSIVEGRGLGCDGLLPRVQDSAGNLQQTEHSSDCPPSGSLKQTFSPLSTKGLGDTNAKILRGIARTRCCRADPGSTIGVKDRRIEGEET